MLFKIFFPAKIRAVSHREEISAKAKRTAYKPLELAKLHSPHFGAGRNPAPTREDSNAKNLDSRNGRLLDGFDRFKAGNGRRVFLLRHRLFWPSRV